MVVAVVPGRTTAAMEVMGRDHTSGDSFIQIGPDDQRYKDMYVSRDGTPASAQDLDLIVAARNYLPLLVREVLRLRNITDGS